VIRIKMIRVKDEDDSEDFELVQTDEDQSKKKEEKEIRAEVTLIELIHMLKDAEENEDSLYGQHQRIAFMLEDLDKPRLEEFLMRLEEFKERVEIKRQKNNCLDVLEEIKEMIENNQKGFENREKAKGPSVEPPTPQSEAQPEGRKLYATKFGEKYHFDKECKGFNGHQNFEWKPCEACKERTQQIIDMSRSGSSSSTDTGVGRELVFSRDFTYYHEGECTVKRTQNKRGAFDKRTLCLLCAREEGILVWARNR